MNHVVYSPAKLNLTLRVGGRNGDGYHEIVSLFLRLPAVETLTINRKNEDNVRDDLVTHTVAVPGVNLVTKAAEGLRKLGWPLPPLEISVWKQVPPGTGFGAGSGNAAAFLGWASRYLRRPLPSHFAKSLGADVPFLLSGSSLALAGGVGERLEALEPLPRLSVFLVVPAWSSSTAEAFADLDYRRKAAKRSAGALADYRSEIEGIVKALRQGLPVGFLPNDFSALLIEKHPDYLSFFAAAQEANSLAWGISGSGSGAFALLGGGRGLSELMSWASSSPWITHLFVLE